MDYRAVKDAVLEFAAQGSGGKFEILVGQNINATYRDVLNSGPVPHEEREFSFASVAGQKQYGLPIYVRKVKNWLDNTNDKNLWKETTSGFDKKYPGNADSGDPSLVFPQGARGVQAYPESDGTLSLVSDNSADDGTSLKARVVGYNTAGVLVTELVTMDGTTPVTTTNSYDSTLGIERVVKSTAAGVSFAGNVTVSDSDANVLSIIPTWWDAPDYVWVQMHPIPSAAITYTMRTEMRKPPLVNDADWPEFDQEYHDLLVWGTTKDLLPTLGKGSVAAVHRKTYEDRMQQFKGETNPNNNTIFVFSNVQATVGLQNRPLRPMIPGVDIGLGNAS